MPVGRAPWVGGPTAEVRRAICGAIAKRGMPVSHAAALAGVHPRTAQRWQEQGHRDIEEGRPETPHAAFAAAVMRARARKTRRLLREIETMAKTPSNVTGQCDPKPLMWLLERTEPEFRQKTESEVTAHVAVEDPRERLARLLAPAATDGGESAVAAEPEPERR